MRTRIVAGAAAAAVLAVILVAWAAFSPRYAVGRMAGLAQAQLGQPFAAQSARLGFSPLSIRIADAALAGASSPGEKLVTAGSVTVPLSLGQLLTQSPDFSAMTLRDAEFALLVDEKGVPNWAFPEAKPGQPLRLMLEQASFRYFDVRNGQGMQIRNVDGLLEIGADGGASFNGSAVVNSRVVRIDLSIKSLARISAGGSPIEVAVETDAVSASFSGRIDTGKALSLAGPVSLTSSSPGDLLRWAGVPLPDDAQIGGPLNLDGALDSVGRAHAIRAAAITLGPFRAAGDVAVDLRGERPKLQGNLRAEQVWLDALLPAAGAAAGEWGRKLLPFALLRSFDAEISMVSQGLTYGSLEAGAARLAAALADGRLEASGAARLENGGTVSFIVKTDAVVLPPSATLSLSAENAEMSEILPALTGTAFLAGPGSFSAELDARGNTQEEMVGTLKGKASLSMGAGRIAGTDLDGTLLALRDRMLEGWTAAPGGTPFTALSAEVTLADGVASLGQAALALPAYTLSLAGNADLLRRAVDLRATPEPAGAAPLPVAALARGKWEAPRLYPDVPDILSNPEGGFARLKELGPPQGN